MKSLKFLCLFLLLGISIVAAQPDPELPEPNYYCNLFDDEYAEYSGVCPDIYEPVCAKYFGTCDDVTCSVLYKTYANTCELCQRHDIISFTFGPCEEEDCGEDCEEEEDEWEGCYEECENCDEEEEEEEEKEEECDECEEVEDY